MAKQVQKVEGRSLSTQPSDTQISDATRLTPRGSSLFDLPVDIYYSPSCRVCNHPHRRDVENRLAAGISHRLLSTVLAKSHPDTAPLPAPGRNSLRRHLTEHMPMQVTQEVAMAADVAKEMGVDIETAGTIVTPYGLLASIVRNGFADIVQGRLKADVKDVIKAAELMLRIEAETDGAVGQQSALQDALRDAIETAQRFIDPTDLPAYAAALDNPILRAMQVDPNMLELDAWEEGDEDDDEEYDDEDAPLDDDEDDGEA